MFARQKKSKTRGRGKERERERKKERMANGKRKTGVSMRLVESWHAATQQIVPDLLSTVTWC